MKKIGKIKKTGLAVTALSVSAALLAGGLACSLPYSAVAEDETPAAPASVELFDGLSVPTKADYGNTFAVPTAPAGTTVKVSAPDSTEVALGAAEDGHYTVEAKQVGNYTVKYYATDHEKAAYSYTVSVSLNEDYFLKVDNNGAGIPTYIKTGGTIAALPEAHIAYYDENKILRYYPGEVVWTIKDSIGDEQNPTGHTYEFGDPLTATERGNLYITYAAQIEEGGSKYFSQTFTVNVQTSFEDKQAPVLTLSGMTSNISVRRAVTLPVATVSDDFDKNPTVEITVTDPNGNPVKIVDIDRHGYAYQDADKIEADKTETDVSKLNYPAVAFDNKDVMTFYPMIAGQYRVKYVARDDAGNVSTSKSWVMTAGDSAAPVFQDVSEWGWQIPEKWGLTVKNAEGDVENKAITIPIPEIYDNKDHMQAIDENDKDLISLYVRITDADYSRDILTFKNVLAKPAEDNGDADCVASNGVYDGGNKQTFSQYSDTPFAFDIAKYDRKDKNGDAVDKTGKYTVYYRATDVAGSRSTKTFTIEYVSTYEDTKAPTIGDISLPEYISTADTTFNIPSVVAKDAESSTIHTEYRIYSDGEYIDVKGGEKADIELRGDDMYLVLDKGKSYSTELKLVDAMYFCVTATDAVGNVAVNSKTVEGEYTAENYTECSDVVKIINKKAEKGYEYSANIAFKTAATVEKGKVTEWTEGTIYTGKKVLAGGFDIAVNDVDMRKYTGFEVSVVDANGNVVNTTLDTFTTYDDTSAVIHVKNIQFTPVKEGTHYLTIRAFDVNNINTVNVYTVNVEKSTTSGGTVKPAAVVTADSAVLVNVKYTLEEANDTFTGAEDGKEYYHAYQLKGGIYSLMGNEFIAKSSDSYSVTNGFVEATIAEGGTYSDIGADFKADGVNNSGYSFSVTDNERPVIEVQGIMPTYAEKSTEDKPVKVEIPSVIAYSSNGAANVKIEVKHSGDTVKLEPVEGTNKYTFEGTKDGVYTISITANRADAAEATATYTVNIGDVVAPDFTVKGGTSSRKDQGDVFTYGKIVLVDESEKGTVNITKKLLNPKGQEVSGATVSGSYNSYKDKTNNGSEIKLDKSGTYTVEYTVRDSVGNEETHRVQFSVTAEGTSSPTTFTALSTTLIIVAVVLLAGVIIYVVRFRKVKK